MSFCGRQWYRHIVRLQRFLCWELAAIFVACPLGFGTHLDAAGVASIPFHRGVLPCRSAGTSGAQSGRLRMDVQNEGASMPKITPSCWFSTESS